MNLFDSFVNALGTRCVDENNKNKIIHKDINNEIQFELFIPPLNKQKQISDPYKDDKVTIIWCESSDIRLSNSDDTLKLSALKIIQIGEDVEEIPEKCF